MNDIFYRMKHYSEILIPRLHDHDPFVCQFQGYSDYVNIFK